jgi:hypothetical protein
VWRAVDDRIALAPGAEENEVAVWVASRVDESLRERPDSHRDFSAIRAAVAMVASDRRESVTLRFDHGYLTIHDGMLGIPDLTLCGDFAALVGLADIPLSRAGRLPLPPLNAARRSAWRTTALELVSGELKVYGMFSHPRLLMRLLRLLSMG